MRATKERAIFTRQCSSKKSRPTGLIIFLSIPIDIAQNQSDCNIINLLFKPRCAACPLAKVSFRW